MSYERIYKNSQNSKDFLSKWDNRGCDTSQFYAVLNMYLQINCRPQFLIQLILYMTFFFENKGEIPNNHRLGSLWSSFQRPQ